VDQTRREFLKTCALAGAAGALAYVGIGCSDQSSPAGPKGPQTMTVNLADYPQLAGTDRAVSLNSTPLSRPILLTHTTGDTYYALDSRCTHQSCTVAASTPTLNCPCHGSHFQLDGAVARGPATRALTAFAVTKDGDVLTIQIG